MTKNMPLIVKAVDTNGHGVHWQPHVGPETRDFLEHVVPVASHEDVCEVAASILRKGVSPRVEAGKETGLVVGYVQSGKTMSFETVAALARDNGFQMVIVVAGTSKPLLEQSTSRIRRDFQINDSNRPRRWIHLPNPENDDPTFQTLRDVFEDWRDEGTPADNRMTVLVTVLKHYQRIGNLTSLIESVDMTRVPVLIIDDEADQASLNTEVAQGEESTTYRRLMALRDALPLHNYVQYTATPQAPLLVSIVDSLSPNFVEVLTPGDAYVGGGDFFGNNHNLVRAIPPSDVRTNTNQLPEPPDSLLEALRIFMVGVGIGLMQGGNRGNRSMLVHPSHRTVHHHEYYNWVRGIFEEWKSILSLPDTDPDKEELIEELRVAYDDLDSTVQGGLPTFDRLAPTLRFAFRRTRLLEVNSRGGRTPEVDWGSAYGWILVGGQAMDRGFTVEGLTVTYMPRGIGIGNADTVQQRARFFGYKRTYLGFCRVYLEQGTHRAFERYVQHEEDMRRQLVEIRDSGRSLNDWKRAFVLDNALRPCRHSVLEFDYIRGQFSDEWVAPRVVLATDPLLTANRQTVTSFVDETSFLAQEGHPNRTDTQRHEVATGLSLRQVMERLLIPIRITSSRDSQRMTGLLLQLSRALDDSPDEVCTVYRMSPLTGRERGINRGGEVTNLFQGEAPVKPRERRGEVYPGDYAIKENGQISIQIHMLDLTRDGEVFRQNVPAIAVWVPARLAIGWIDQDQPIQNI